MSQVQEIKEKIDILDIIGERMSLQRSGKNFRGLCPFHSEKTPSFFVSPELQSFICFGCAKKGDVFTFVQEYDRLTFPEAMELLAQKAGVELEKGNWNDPQEQERRAVFSVLDLAQKYFAYLLEKHASGEPARQYLQQRGLGNSLIRGYGIGYAPDGWDNLLTYLNKKKKFSIHDIEQAGLIIKGQGGKYYDRFRGRVMFPLHDHRGRVVGFSGRLLDSDGETEKCAEKNEIEDRADTSQQ